MSSISHNNIIKTKRKHNTWEPESNLTPFLIEEYNRQKIKSEAMKQAAGSEDMDVTVIEDESAASSLADQYRVIDSTSNSTIASGRQSIEPKAKRRQQQLDEPHVKNEPMVDDSDISTRRSSMSSLFDLDLIPSTSASNTTQDTTSTSIIKHERTSSVGRKSASNTATAAAASNQSPILLRSPSNSSRKSVETAPSTTTTNIVMMKRDGARAEFEPERIIAGERNEHDELMLWVKWKGSNKAALSMFFYSFYIMFYLFLAVFHIKIAKINF